MSVSRFLYGRLLLFFPLSVVVEIATQAHIVIGISSRDSTAHFVQCFVFLFIYLLISKYGAHFFLRLVKLRCKNAIYICKHAQNPHIKIKNIQTPTFFFFRIPKHGGKPKHHTTAVEKKQQQKKNKTKQNQKKKQTKTKKKQTRLTKTEKHSPPPCPRRLALTLR
jgi:hypothetical protein